MNIQNSYFAYGLIIHSELPLPELSTIDEECGFFTPESQVCIHFGPKPRIPTVNDELDRWIHVTPNETILYWRDIGTFLVRNGCEVIVSPAPQAAPHLLRLFILGTTLAMLLHQREQLTVLHASVVSIAGKAVAFAGASGAGKSTVAALLHARGHCLLADDILAICTGNGIPMVLPGYPHFKLWPDAVTAIGQTPAKLPRLRPEVEKRAYRVGHGFARTAVPLGLIYVLELGDKPETHSLSRMEALWALMPHWYGARFGSDVLDTLGAGKQFLQCAYLAKSIPVRRLKRPPFLSMMSDVVELIEEHTISHDLALSHECQRNLDYQKV